MHWHWRLRSKELQRTLTAQARRVLHSIASTHAHGFGDSGRSVYRRALLR